MICKSKHAWKRTTLFVCFCFVGNFTYIPLFPSTSMYLIVLNEILNL